MPTYVYRCSQCDATVERVETMAEHELAKPDCPGRGSRDVVIVPAPSTAITGKKS